MKKFVNFRTLLKATLGIVLTSVVLHLIVSAVFALVRWDYNIANMFNIIGLSYVFPALGQGIVSFWLSIAYCVVGAGIWYVIFTVREDRKK